MSKAIHYAGEIRTPTLHVGAGWAACCSGQRAYAIQAAVQHTMDRRDVTCRACLKKIAAHDAHTPTRHARKICGSVPSVFLGRGKYPKRHTVVSRQDHWVSTACGIFATGEVVMPGTDPRLNYWNICPKCVAEVAKGTWRPRPVDGNATELTAADYRGEDGEAVDAAGGGA